MGNGLRQRLRTAVGRNAAIAAFSVSIGLIACGPATPPSYITSSGIQVWDPGGHYTAERVEQLSQVFLEQFAWDWPRERAAETVSHARIFFLDVNTYDSFGEQVAGTVDPESLEITIAAAGYDLPESALAHELVHYTDLSINGWTDNTHASWAANGTWDSLENVATIDRHLEMAQGVNGP
jgi:hypothetical protein